MSQITPEALKRGVPATVFMADGAYVGSPEHLEHTRDVVIAALQYLDLAQLLQVKPTIDHMRDIQIAKAQHGE